MLVRNESTVGQFKVVPAWELKGSLPKLETGQTRAAQWSSGASQASVGALLRFNGEFAAAAYVENPERPMGVRGLEDTVQEKYTGCTGQRNRRPRSNALATLACIEAESHITRRKNQGDDMKHLTWLNPIGSAIVVASSPTTPPVDLTPEVDNIGARGSPLLSPPRKAEKHQNFLHVFRAKGALKARDVVFLMAATCVSSLATAADLGAACKALNSAAWQGMLQPAVSLWSKADPNAVNLTPSDVLPNIFYNGQTAYLPESRIALADTSASRQLKTGGAYITSANITVVNFVPACDIVGVIFAENQRDLAVADPNYVAPNITFKLTVPLNWADRADRKLIHFGGGLFNGKVYAPGALQNFNAWAGGHAPIANGSALIASDSGHRGENTLAFAKLPANGHAVTDQIAVKNYAGEHIKRVRDVAVTLLQQLSAAQPTRTYFVGISTGGREALKAVTRFTPDYTGAIAIAPAWDVLAAFSSGNKCAGLSDASLRALGQKYAIPGASDSEKRSNLCKIVDLAAQPAEQLSAFRAKKGKLVVVQGTDDDVVPAAKTDFYWEQLGALNLQRDELARYYKISGFKHGVGYVPHFDLISTLDTWISDNAATPEAQQLKFYYADGLNALNLIPLLLSGELPVWPFQPPKTACAYPKQQDPVLNSGNAWYFALLLGTCKP